MDFATKQGAYRNERRKIGVVAPLLGYAEFRKKHGG